jgi:hypothetical protein
MDDYDPEIEGPEHLRLVLAHIFDYEGNRRPGDPEQDKLASVLAERFGRDTQINFQILAHRFLSARNGACPDIWPRSGLEHSKQLLKLKKKIREISQLFQDLPDSLRTELFLASYHKAEVCFDSDLDKSERLQTYLEVLRNRSTPSLQGFHGLDLISKHCEEFIQSFDKAIESTDAGVPEGNKKIESWRLVEACVDVCELEKGYISVPKSINGSDEFYRLVSDIFTLFDIDSDPSDIFDSWRAYIGRHGE